MSRNVEQLIQVIEQLPEDRIAEVLNFARFLLWQIKPPDESTPFELWAERLAQAKGFAYLTEEQVARVVHESRQAGQTRLSHLSQKEMESLNEFPQSLPGYQCI